MVTCMASLDIQMGKSFSLRLRKFIHVDHTLLTVDYDTANRYAKCCSKQALAQTHEDQKKLIWSALLLPDFKAL